MTDDIHEDFEATVKLPEACLPEERDDALEGAAAMLEEIEKEEEAANNSLAKFRTLPELCLAYVHKSTLLASHTVLSY